MTESPYPIGSIPQSISGTNTPVEAGDRSHVHGGSGSGLDFGGDSKPASVQSPSLLAANAKSPEDLLWKLSLSTFPQDLQSASQPDPCSAYPNLSLSGRIISATFVLPFDIKQINGDEWELGARKGTSALFELFNHLFSPGSGWDHTLVGWTGDITRASKAGASPKSDVTPEEYQALLKASAPVPVDHKQETKLPERKGIEISMQSRKQLERLLERSSNGKCVPIWLTDESQQDSATFTVTEHRHWCRFAEREVYNLFHYKQNEPVDGRDQCNSWADFCKMNRIFADRIAEIYKPGDIIIIHDFQLLLLPNLLRQRIPGVYIGFFLHTPFPSSELYRCLSQRKNLLQGMLGANMIGFQSYSYSRHFSSCCKRILGFDSSSAGVDARGAHVAVDIFPLGINAEKIEFAAFKDPSVEEKLRRIKQIYAGKKIIIGRDRTDALRGVVQKLQAFETLLDRYPEWRDKVILVQITSGAERDAEQESADKRYINKIASVVSRINGRYGNLSSSPVQHFPQYLEREEYLALLRVADLGLITSVRDGMNTTSLEYVICQKENHGPLILSEFSGTAGSLSSAIHVNPWDFGGVAEAINQALRLSDEAKIDQHTKLYDYVTSNDTKAWKLRFLNRLLVHISSSDQSFVTPVLDSNVLFERYNASQRRLFIFDYDGTLTPIVQDPNAATPSDRVLRNLKQLSNDEKNEVWIISGRDQKFLDEWMGHLPNLGLSAEHGSFIRYPGSDVWHNVAEGTNMDWQAEVLDIFGHYTERTQGSFIEQKKIALTWHYRRADPEYGVYQARACQKELEAKVGLKWEVEVMTGKANLEVRPRFVNKGEVVSKLVAQYTGSSEDGAQAVKERGDLGMVLCLGDDFTDEDMFRALKNSKLPKGHVFSVTVGAPSKQTLADWHLLEPADVVSMITMLNDGGQQTAGSGSAGTGKE